MGRLDGKVAVISGASGGIGAAASKRFTAEGAHVIGVDIADEGGKKLEKELKDQGLSFEFMKLDVTSGKSVSAAFEKIGKKHNQVDVLFNNAGTIMSKPFLDTTEEDWDRIQSINLKSVFMMMKACIPLMKKGSIINVSSTGAHISYPTMSAYGAAKAGIIQLSRVAGAEFGPDIRINSICPGVTDTAMPRSFIAGLDNQEELWASYGERTMAKRVAMPEEVASVALFLASDDASYVSGASIMVDSGSTVL